MAKKTKNLILSNWGCFGKTGSKHTLAAMSRACGIKARTRRKDAGKKRSK